MEVPKSEISKKADAARAKATGLKAAREKAANAIAGDLDAARAEVSRHDALPELSAPQHLALENARKRVKHLTSQLAEAGAAIAAAQEAIEAAEKVRDRAWLADLDADARKRDAALIQDFITTRARWQEERATLFADLAKAHAIASSLRPDPSVVYTPDSRGTLVALHPPQMGILETAAKVLEGVQVRKQAALVESQHRAAAARGDAPYKPPVGEHGDWVDEERPPRPLEGRTS